MGKKPRTPAEVWPVAHFLAEEMEARGWSVEETARRCAFTAERLRGVLNGTPLSEPDGCRLADGFGTSATFWLNLDAAFWTALERELNREETTP